MTIAGFLARYEATLAGLPRVLARWEALPEAMQEHFANELAYTLAARASLMARCQTLGAQGITTAQRVVALDRTLRSMGERIALLLGVRIGDFLMAPNASVACQSVTCM